MASIKCWHCKGTHTSVADVKVCGAPVQVTETHTEPVSSSWMERQDVAAGIASEPANWVRDRAARLHAQQVAVHAPNRPAHTPKPTAVDRIRKSAACLPDVATTRYAVLELDLEKSTTPVWKFYRVDRPQTGKWKGYTFLKIVAGSEEWSIKNLTRVAGVLEAIAFNVEEALSQYGHQIGKCGICHRQLTVPESIERGIGPICAGKL